MSVRSLYDTYKFEGYEQLAPSTGDKDTTTFISIKDVSKILAWVYRSAAGASANYLDKLTLLQATDSSGTSAKTLGGGISAANLALGGAAAVGDKYVLEADVGMFDTENDFFFVGLRSSLIADAGTNTLEVVWLSDPNVKTRDMSATKTEWANKDA